VVRNAGWAADVLVAVVRLLSGELMDDVARALVDP
jgi:hypothetical protein